MAARSTGSAWALLQPFKGVTSGATAPWRWAALIGVGSAACAGLLGLWIATDALPIGEAQHGDQSLPLVASVLGAAKAVDEQLFVFLNSLGSPRWDGVWLLITNKLAWLPLYVALLCLVYRHVGLRNLLVVVGLLIVMITLTDQLANMFKHAVERPRPCREEHLEEIIRYIAPRCGRYGYFSAHAANSMAFAVLFGSLFRRIYRHLGLVLIVWALVVGYSRIYVGVHYPLDTLTGFVIGALAGVLIYKFSRRLKLSRVL